MLPWLESTANLPSQFPAMIVYVTLSPTSGSVAETVPTAVPVAASSDIEKSQVADPNAGALLQAAVVCETANPRWPSVFYHRRANARGARMSSRTSCHPAD